MTIRKTAAVLAFLVLCIGLESCDKDAVPTEPTGTGILFEPVRGTSFSPQGFPLDYSKTAEFYEELSGIDHSSAMWNGSWRDDAVNGSDARATYRVQPLQQWICVPIMTVYR